MMFWILELLTNNNPEILPISYDQDYSGKNTNINI